MNHVGVDLICSIILKYHSKPSDLKANIVRAAAAAAIVVVVVVVVDVEIWVQRT